MDGEDLELETVAAPSPLRERLAEFRTSGDTPPAPAAGKAAAAGGGTGELEEEEEVVEQTPVPRAGEREGAEEEVEVEETEEERQAREAREAEETDEERAAREAREAAGEPEPGKDAQGRDLRSIEIPTLEGDGKVSTLIIDGLPQEYYDSIQNHVRRSLRLEHVERRLGEAKREEAIAAFYKTDPLNAMRLVYRDQPDTAAAFVENWIQQNPKLAADFIGKHFPEGRAKDTLDLQAKLAQRDMVDELDKAWNNVSSATRHKDFADGASQLVNDLVAPLGLDEAERDDFEQIAGNRIVKEMNRRQALGASPFLEDRDIVRLVQPLLKRFTGTVARAATNGKARLTKGPKETEEAFQKRAAKADQLRQLRTTSGQPINRTRAGGTSKRLGKGSEGEPKLMGDRIKALRQGKL